MLLGNEIKMLMLLQDKSVPLNPSYSFIPTGIRQGFLRRWKLRLLGEA